MKTAVKSIRAYCIDCGDGTFKEVRLCPVVDCPLYPYRYGRRPTETEKQKIEQVIKDRK